MKKKPDEREKKEGIDREEFAFERMSESLIKNKRYISRIVCTTKRVTYKND